MKNYFKFKSIAILGLLSIMLIRCDSAQKSEQAPKALSLEEQLENYRKIKRQSLDWDVEKLVLLSEATPIDFDTLKEVLIEYFAQIDVLPFDSSHSKTPIIEALDKVSEKFKIYRFRLANIIYSYQFEMIKRGEIEESAIENYEEEIDYGDDHSNQYE